jgi:FemAB-related protein (PEP-CTERM system-associated)
LQAQNAARWDGFVEGCPAATFFHRAGWKEVVERAFGYPTYFLYAEAGGRIRGVLPMGHIRSRLFGNALISTPFCVYGGIAADDPAAARALEEAARDLAQDLGVDYLELRQREARTPDPPIKDFYVTFRKEIAPDPETNMRAIPRKQRAMVRKGIQAGLASEIDDDVERFYRVYSESVRNLGTPVLPRKWFRILREIFGDACEILTVTKDGRPVSSVLSYYFRDEVLPYYGGGTGDARPLKANDFMYWELMRRACERDIRIFDYGRSKVGTGSYHFKKNWGFEPEPLHYQYRLIRARRLPNVSPLNPRYRLLVKAWRRMPLALSRAIGAMVSPYLA